jgi:hypothetical protein
VDLSKLTTSDKVIAGSGLLLFIASFLTWFKVSISGFSSSGNGWDVGFFWGGIPALLGLLSAGIVLGTKLGTLKMPELPVSTGQAMLIAGGVAAVIVVLKLLIGIDTPSGFGAVGGDVSRGIGIYLATLASLGLAGGGFMAYQEEQSGSSPA